MLQRKVADGFDRKKTKLGVFTGFAHDSCQPEPSLSRAMRNYFVGRGNKLDAMNDIVCAADVALKNVSKE